MRRYFVCLLSLALISCQSTRVIDGPLSETDNPIEAGDRIELVLKDSTRITLHVASVTRTHINGSDGNHQFSIPIETIDQIRYKRASIAQSVGVGIFATVAAVTVWALAAGWELDY